MKTKIALLFASWLLFAGAHGAEINVLAAGAMKPVLLQVVPAFDRRTGNRATIEFGTAGDIAERVAAGEKVDLLIVPGGRIEAMEKSGRVPVGDSVPLGKVGIGVAVREGAPVPDISTPDAFRATLLAAKSIVYVDPEKGTSGTHLAAVIEKLGLTEQLKFKTRTVAGGYAIEPVARGEVELGMQQFSEVMAVKGVRVVGLLPEALQKWTTYTGVVAFGSRVEREARALLEYLASAETTPVYIEKGFARP
jgi:molybdate transport system substrate-binding protein